MSKELKMLLKAIQFTTALLFFLYTCGALYLIAFWSTFRLDITNIVGITDIPKSFVFPFAPYFRPLFLVAISILILNSIFDARLTRPLTIWLSRHSTWYLAVPFIVLGISWYILKQQFYYEPLFWIISTIVMPIILSFTVERIPTFHNIFPSNPTFRTNAIYLIILTLLSSYCAGKIKSVEIYSKPEHAKVILKAKDEKSEKQLPVDSTNLKLLDYLGNKIIVSSWDNQRVYILNQDEYDLSIRWLDFPKKK
jgi:hypothetical protein